MDPFLSAARAKQKETISLIRDLVECESPSDSPDAIARFCNLFEARISGMARVRRIRGGAFGPHLQCEFDLPGTRKSGRVLVLGHSDTVYPLGTSTAMPYRESRGRIYGPGVYDMKAGIAFFVTAMKILRERNTDVPSRVMLQLNSDEEVGSESSRPLTEKESLRSKAVLVVEPGQGPEGFLKTERKGVGDYKVIVRGRSSHAGVDFSAGASAITEIARQIQQITAFTDLPRGITVNPGVITGGTRTNVVADFAQVEVDVRIGRLRDAAGLDKKFRRLRTFDKRCAIEVTGGINRPPMEKTKGSRALFTTARQLAADIGIQLEEAATGGGSDGNFTAALGVPTLDGLGAVGEGAHSPGECIYADRIADRIALLAKLVAAL
jgi:glutamate carboxypeptidase